MVTRTGVWTADQVEAFLQESTIPIRIATSRGDGSLWLVALWFRFREGAFECATAADADLVRFLRTDPAVAFDVSTNSPPYRGVRGNGTASLAPDTDKEVLGDLVSRYLGESESPLAEWLLSDAREEIRIRIQPDELYSWDYSERMGSA